MAPALSECSDVVGRLLQQTDRIRTPPLPGRPTLRSISWRARQLAGLQGAEAVGSHACRGFFTCPFESFICRGAHEERFPQMGTWGRRRTGKQEDWAGSACISARGSPRASSEPGLPGKGLGSNAQPVSTPVLLTSDVSFDTL